MRNIIIVSTIMSCLGTQIAPILPVNQTVLPLTVKAATLDSHIIKTGGKAYYMENGKALTGLFTRNNKTYYAPEWDKGALKTGLQLVNNKKYYFDETTYAQKIGIVEVAYGDKKQKHYFLPNGGVALGIFTDALGNTYYFSGSSGIMVYGIQVINGKKYYFDEKTGKQKTGIVTINYASGAQTHYFLKEGGIAKGLYTDISGNTYYFAGDAGVMAYGIQVINGKKYYFDNNTGKQKTGFITINYETGKQTHYFMKEGGIKQNGFESINGKTYYFAKDSGILFKDINVIDNKKYYFHPTTGELLTGIYKAKNGYSYYFDHSESTGVKTGLQTYNGETYLFHKQSGIMQTGLFSLNKDLYYFNEETGKALKNTTYNLYHVLVKFNDKGIMDSYRIETGYQNDVRPNVIAKALSKIGVRYTTDADGFVCSSFVTYLYENLGVDLWEHGAESFEQAQFVKQKNAEITKDKLKPGDIIFWAKPSCDEPDCDHIDEVHHIAIYLGNDKIIEANETLGMVDVQSITSDESYTLYSYANIVPKDLESLDAPEQLTVNSSENEKLKISWKSADLADGYILYRKASTESTYKQIAKILGKENTYFNDTAAQYSPYSYKIVSYRNVNGSIKVSGMSDAVEGMRKLKNVENLTKEASGKNKVSLSWDKVAGAEGYIIYRKIGNGNFEYRYMVKGTTYTDTTASNSEFNFYRVYPYVTINGIRKLGASGKYVYEKGNVTAVDHLSAISVGKSKVSLSWDKVAGAEGYIIYRRIGNGNFEYRYMVKETAYTDTTASNSEFNFYRVCPYFTENNKRILGPAGKYVYQKGSVVAADNLKAISSGRNKVTLSWNSVADAEGYIIYRRIGNGNFEYRYMVKGTTYTDTTASNSEFNFYRVYPYITENGKRVLGPSKDYKYAKGN